MSLVGLIEPIDYEADYSIGAWTLHPWHDRSSSGGCENRWSRKIESYGVMSTLWGFPSN